MISRNRNSRGVQPRKENIREQRKSVEVKLLLSFNFKYLDETQPNNNPQSICSWHDEGLLPDLFNRLKQVSGLTRDEALKQQQIKIYNDFPPKDKTDFFHPQHVNEAACWGVLKAVGGQRGVVAGYIEENTFYVVFLDKEHRFWITPKKNT